MTSPRALPARRWSALLAVAAALAGCSTSAAATDRTAPTAGSPAVSSRPASPATTATRAVPLTRPSPAARMICDQEIRGDVATLFRLPEPPKRMATWQNSVYRCRYGLPHGQLTLAVSEDGTHRAALARFAAARHRANRPTAIQGLASFGLPAFETPDGVVMFAKDDKTLTVDARGLPASGIPDGQSLDDVAYQIASDVLSCWHH